MAEYIDRDAFIKSINESITAAIEWGKSAVDNEIKIRAEQAIATFCESSLRARQMPASDVQPVVHGHWNDNDTCSVCGDEPLFEYDVRILNYCPNCGADMRGDEDV